MAETTAPETAPVPDPAKQETKKTRKPFRLPRWTRWLNPRIVPASDLNLARRRSAQLTEAEAAIMFFHAKIGDLSRSMAHLALVSTAGALREGRNHIRCDKGEVERARLFKLVPDEDQLKQGNFRYDLVLRRVKEPAVQGTDKGPGLELMKPAQETSK